MMKRLLTAGKILLAAAAVVGVIAMIAIYRGRLFHPVALSKAPSATALSEPSDRPQSLKISSQARKNLGLVAQPVRPREYWRTIVLPGEIDDRPGLSDRGVTSPAVGVVTAIHAFPGDTVRPGESLFTLQLFSEYLQNTQSALFQATREVDLLQTQISRLSEAARSGAVPESRLIEVQNQLSRQKTLIQAYRQDMLTRGLSPQQVDQAAQGSFVSTIEIHAPPPSLPQPSDGAAALPLAEPVGLSVDYAASQAADETLVYEVQTLNVELGQQIQAGQVLAVLANHRWLYIVGHAFKHEARYLEQTVQAGRPLEVEFAEDAGVGWPEVQQTFEIRHLSNVIDQASRTFDFFVPLMNQSQTYRKQGQDFVIWRFRPGQRVRIRVPVEKYENVFVLPTEAVVREGPEAYVFRQNGDLFQRFAVHVVHEDRHSVVIANDGSFAPGSFLAQDSAASLNRILKSQAASGEDPSIHVHADGTTHAAH